MFVDYRLSITEVVIDKQLSTLIKLSNESRYLVDSWLRCHLCLQASFCVLEKVDTVIYPVSNLIQFRIKWSYRHELHSSCSIKKQIFCMVMKSIFFSSSARSQILKTYLHAKNKSVLRDDLSN